jgi:cytochrome c oxidase subunit 2
MVVLMRFTSLFVVTPLLFCQQGGEPDRKPDRVISIAAERFTFNPSRITLKEGQLVEFVLTSDDTDHGFKIPGTEIDVAIPPAGRGEVRVRFVAAKKGRYVFECSRPCGAGHNLMRGTLEIK